MPIKVVENNSNSTRDMITVGNGLSTSVPAIMELGPKYKNRILRVLLDTGSDGDLMFLQKG